MIQWFLPPHHDDDSNLPNDSQVTETLEGLISASTPEEIHHVLEERQRVLLSEITLIMLCLTIAQKRMNGNDESANNLQGYLSLLVDARTNGIVQACQRFNASTEDFVLPLSRTIELLSRSIAQIEYASDPSVWAELHTERGDSYMQRSQEEEQADSIEQAIANYDAALTVFTKVNIPMKYAQVHMKRGIAHIDRRQGEPTEDLEQAIADFDAALNVLTREDTLLDWASAHMLRGLTYIDRSRGERDDNLEKAIANFNTALTVFTREESPYEWALMHMNRGYAYMTYLRGERAENLEQAIADYNAALEVFTRETTPHEWANTYMNRGLTYMEREQEERAENVEQALLDFGASLAVFTQETTPLEWALAHRNRGSLYAGRANGDRTENLKQALADYNAALTVFTRIAAPSDYRDIHLNLAQVYGQLGERQEAQKAFLEVHEVSHLLIEIASSEIREYSGAPVHDNQIPFDIENIAAAVKAFLEVKNWNERYNILNKLQGKLLSNKALKLLRDQVAEQEETSRDGRVEYLEMHLHLLEDAQAHGIELAWQRFLSEYLKAVEAMQMVSMTQTFDEIQQMMEKQKELYASTAVLALLHSSLAELRTSENTVTARLLEQSLRYLSEMRRGKIIFQQQSQETLQQGLEGSLNATFDQPPPPLENNIFSMANLQSLNLNDPYFLLVMEEMQKLTREQAYAMLPLITQMNSLIQTPEISSHMLESIDRGTTPYLWATLHSNRAASYLDRPQENHQKAIDDCNVALSILTREATPSMWAQTRLIRGCVYINFITRDQEHNTDTTERSPHIEQAINDLNAALSVFTSESMPLQWATAIGARGFAYLELERIAGNTIHNHEQARTDFDAALSVLIDKTTPIQCAPIYINRGTLYLRRTIGDRKKNLEQAIADCNAGLSIFNTPLSQEMSEQWASAMVVRGLAYTERIEGERRQNLEQALADFNTALTVNTRTRLPQEWARTMTNRGNVYLHRIAGDRRQNLEQALDDYNNALSIFTPESTPIEWGQTLMNRGHCYQERIVGDRGQNQEQALEDYTAALSAFSGERMRFERAGVIANRGSLYLLRIAGDRRQNFEKALADYNNALTIYSPSETPLQWAMILVNRGMTHRGLALSIGLLYRGVGIRTFASRLFSQHQASLPSIIAESNQQFEQALADLYAALKLLTRESTPREWAIALRERALTHASHLSGGNREQHVRQAIADYYAALTVLTPEDTPFDWAIALVNRGVLYRERVLDNHLDEADLALADIEAAMTVLTREIAPANYRRIQDIRASVFEKLGRWKEAHTALLAARDVQRDLVAAASRELNRSDIIAEFALVDTYVRDARAILHLDQPNLAEVAVALEEGRAQSLRAALDLDTIIPERIRNPEARKRAKSFLATRNKWRKCQHDMLVPLGTEEVALKEKRLRDLQEAYEAFLSARNSIRQHDNPDFMTPVPTLESIAYAVSTPEEALVYLVAEASLEGTGGMALMITHDLAGMPHVQHVSLPRLTDIAIYDLMEIEDNTSPVIRPGESIATLGKLGLDELARVLSAQGIRRVTLIPYGWLGLFPLPAVLVSHPGGSKRQLGDIFEVTFAPSAHAVEIAHKRAHPADKQRQLLVFAGNPKPLPQEARDLPFAEAEADTIRRIAKEHGYPSTKICYLRPSEVTRERVVEALKQAKYVHLALHGEYRVDEPRRSRLLLAGKEHTSEVERSIYLSEVLDGSIDLKGLRLLTLSACETSIIDTRRTPDEVLGLAASFLQAGAAGVIASLWAVDDEATYLLMTRFAQLYLDQQGTWSPAQALARAQRWLRDEATNRVLEDYKPLPSNSTLRSLRYSHTGVMANIRIKASRSEPDVVPYADPFYWAGFVVTGC